MNRIPLVTKPAGLRALAMSLACASGAALAQSPAEGPPPADDAWRFSLGLGAMNGPSFPGSDTRKTHVLPMLGASYGRWFIGGGPETGGEGLGIGATLFRDSHWQLGAGISLGLEKARTESDDSRLAGLGNIDGSTRAALFGRYGDGWLGARASVSTDIGGHQQGTQAGVDLEARWRLSPALSMMAGPGLHWGDRRYTQTFYGINATQSAASGRAEYAAGAGLNDLHFSVGANYRLTPQVSVGARVTASRLQGDAASSPLAFDKTPTSFGLFGQYRF